ncbi:hypothetical protein BDQ12DRAFT_255635 [Crucibulum laeve]|uniref:NACHT domain-containing protein n=1 Tax=Crucibulum laeve TaxID=68775 RepID=A0A5C3LU06_9AGAR|nr:hypothetical protein BDQ12DRAFT_255635 [Crucibulum laeve]
MSFQNSHHFVIQNSTFNDIAGDFNQVIAESAFHNSSERHPPPKCHPDTRNLILDIIRDWATHPIADISALWLYGPAGAGKTAIAQTVSEELADQNRLAASFFFSRGKERRSSCRHLIPSLAFQLALSMPKLRTPIQNVVDVDPSIFDKPLRLQTQKLLIEPCQDMMRREFQPMVVVIDGIDECEDITGQQELLLVVKDTLCRKDLPIRFLLASRPEPGIRRIFDQPAFTNVLRRIVLDEAFHPNSDIAIFLRSGFLTIRQKHQDTMTSAPLIWPSQTVIDHIVQKSSGQFIYASTVLKYVDDEYSRPHQRLEAILQIPSPCTTAFADLDQLYLQILSANPHTDVLLQVLGTIVVLREPLCSYDLDMLLSLEEGDTLLAVKGLHSVLDVPHHDAPNMKWTPIKVLHASLFDFLRDKSRSGIYYVDVDKFHTALTFSCFLWLKERHENSQRDGTASPINSESALHFLYAIENWDYHLSHSPPSHELMEQLKRLYIKEVTTFGLGKSSGNVLKWLETAGNQPGSQDLLTEWASYYTASQSKPEPNSIIQLRSERICQSAGFLQPTVEEGRRFVRMSLFH